MIRAHIQGEFRQGIEPLDFSWKVANRMANAVLLAHNVFLGPSVAARVPLFLPPLQEAAEFITNPRQSLLGPSRSR